MGGASDPSPLTLRRLLERAGSRVSVYDVGRRVGALDDATFAAFEAGMEPYPQPMQRKAWLALVQVPSAATGEPVIWFLHLSLDEQGLLIPTERDYLLGRLLESARAHQQGADAQAFLQDNPHAFRPRDDRMALFHARLSADLGLPPSRYYAHALDYFRGTPGWDQWGFVGYQGIADVACRHTAAPLDAAIAELPAEPLVALCHCLESQTIDAPLETALRRRLQAEMDGPGRDIAVTAALVRGLASRAGETTVREQFGRLLDTASGRNIEILAAIAGRAWEALGDTVLLRSFLEKLARNDHGQAAFEQCVDDLLSVPSLAAPVRGALRGDTCSRTLRGSFMKMTGRGGTSGGS